MEEGGRREGSRETAGEKALTGHCLLLRWKKGPQARECRQDPTAGSGRSRASGGARCFLLLLGSRVSAFWSPEQETVNVREAITLGSGWFVTARSEGE